MNLKEFIEHLTNYREIQFLYMGKQYMASHFGVKSVVRRSHEEYWLSYPHNDSKDNQRFSTIEELLNCQIEGKAIKEIFDVFEIIDIF